MDTRTANEATAMKNRTTSQRKSDRELVITRTIDAPARIVFEAWTRPELFKQWWLPKSLGMTLLSCEMDVRPGGKYKLVLKHGESEPMAFYGRYTDVKPNARIVWTNEEGGEDGSVTTVTFEERGGKTFVVLTELYPSKEALDAAIASGATAGDMNEQFAQLEELIVKVK
jgi:uncharacterized protein YndB with AHSA1/START domain